MIYKREAKILRLLKKNKPIPDKLINGSAGLENLVSQNYITKEYITPPDKDITIKYVIRPKGIDALSDYNRQKAFNIISLTVTIITLLLTLFSFFADYILNSFN